MWWCWQTFPICEMWGCSNELVSLTLRTCLCLLVCDMTFVSTKSIIELILRRCNSGWLSLLIYNLYAKRTWVRHERNINLTLGNLAKKNLLIKSLFFQWCTERNDTGSIHMHSGQTEVGCLSFLSRLSCLRLCLLLTAIPDAINNFALSKHVILAKHPIKALTKTRHQNRRYLCPATCYNIWESSERITPYILWDLYLANMRYNKTCSFGMPMRFACTFSGFPSPAVMRLSRVFHCSRKWHLFGNVLYIKLSWGDISLETALRCRSPHTAKRQSWLPSNNAFGYLEGETSSMDTCAHKENIWVPSNWAAKLL